MVIFLYSKKFVMRYDDVYDELKSDFKNNKSKNNISISTYIFLLVILLIPLVVFLLRRKPYTFVSSFDNLPEPVQVPISWSAMLSVYWKNLLVDFMSSYEINWKVIAVKDFNSVSDFSIKISPKDIVLWWWFMWVQENIDKFVWNDGLDDMLVLAYVKSENKSRLDDIWWDSLLQNNYSNNRLIPSDKKVRFLLNKIDEWDEVRIKWYLAYVHLDDDSWKWWPSCMTIRDKSCEVIYVTDVVWLKEI